jgi:hypothetical protein
VVLYDHSYISTPTVMDELDSVDDEDVELILSISLVYSLSTIRKRVQMNQTLAKYSIPVCALLRISSLLDVPQDVIELIMKCMFECS